MWRLRPFRPSDWTALFELHAKSGNEFDIPQRMEEAIVTEDEETGKVIQIQGNRVTRESYVWVDHEWKTAQLRWRVFCEMHEALRLELERKGVEDIHVYIEPAKTGGHSGFARRLMKYLRWKPDMWKSYHLRIREK